MALRDALPQAHRRLAMGMDVGGESGGSMATPNVVPLIDILLVLIIIFMVITPLIPKDRKSTRLNSSHGYISYAVFCLKKKKINSITISCLLPAFAVSHEVR